MNMPDQKLSSTEKLRYARQLGLAQVGAAGQLKLKAASVLIVGAGGLGSPVAMYLAATGIGRIGLVDFDKVDHSNLHRQIIHRTDDVGRPKVESASETIAAINPDVQIESFEVALSRDNAMRIAEQYDIVIDGTDNFATRYLVNDVCVLLGKPNCYGSVLQFEGQASVFSHEGGPCYRCLYPAPPAAGVVPSCAEGGVLGVLPGMIGMIQATEAVKIILGIGETLSGRLLLYDSLDMSFRELKVRRDPTCPICGDLPTIRELADYEAFCGNASSQQAVAQSPWDLSPTEAKRQLDSDPSIRLLDVRESDEYEICHINGRLIPLDQLADQIGRLDPNDTYIVHCKFGKRSAEAVDLLRRHGFDRVFNLRGGIDAWSQVIDPDIRRY